MRPDSLDITRMRQEIDRQMVFIQGGPLSIGSDEGFYGDLPIQEVRVPDFYLGQYPVTNAEYLAFVAAVGTNAPEWMEAGSAYNIDTGESDRYKQLGEALYHPDHPVVGVSWHDAQAYCAWLSDQTGYDYRLPSEAEWEYAARGGQSSRGFWYAGSHRLKEVAWYDENSHGTTQAVGLKGPNELGLYDMSGNVWEWCADHWHDNDEAVPQDGSAWLDKKNNARRVVRGGSWTFNVFNCRVSVRDNYGANDRFYFVGFRVARYRPWNSEANIPRD